MRDTKNTHIIGIDMTGQNATVVWKDGIQVSDHIGLVRVRSLRVFHAERFGPTFTYLGKEKTVLALDDIAKITFDFKDGESLPVISGLPAAALCDGNDKQRYYCDAWIDLRMSKVKLQVAIAGTPGWLLLGFETFD